MHIIHVTFLSNLRADLHIVECFNDSRILVRMKIQSFYHTRELTFEEISEEIYYYPNNKVICEIVMKNIFIALQCL